MKRSVTGFNGFFSDAGLTGVAIIGWPLCVALVLRGRREGFDAVDTSELVQAIYTVMVFAIAMIHIGNGSGQAEIVMALLGPGLGSGVYGSWVANCVVLVSMVTSEATGTKAVDRQRRRAPLRSRGMNPTRMTMPTNHRQGPR